jgi:hypothetical protein
MDNLPYNYPRKSDDFADSSGIYNFNDFSESCNFELRNMHSQHEMPFGSSYQGYHDECYIEEGAGFQCPQGYDPYHSYEPQRSGHLNS